MSELVMELWRLDVPIPLWLLLWWSVGSFLAISNFPRKWLIDNPEQGLRLTFLGGPIYWVIFALSLVVVILGKLGRFLFSRG